jgi:hypothetical protein
MMPAEKRLHRFPRLARRSRLRAALQRRGRLARLPRRSHGRLERLEWLGQYGRQDQCVVPRAPHRVYVCAYARNSNRRRKCVSAHCCARACVCCGAHARCGALRLCSESCPLATCVFTCLLRHRLARFAHLASHPPPRVPDSDWTLIPPEDTAPPPARRRPARHASIYTSVRIQMRTRVCRPFAFLLTRSRVCPIAPRYVIVPTYPCPESGCRM